MFSFSQERNRMSKEQYRAAQKLFILEKLNLDPNTLVHDGGHPQYNSYVGKELQKIYNEPTIDMKRYKLWLFLHYLKDNLKFKGSLPWN